jgi:5-methylcytosine-specific restriction endonuclease McrA
MTERTCTIEGCGGKLYAKGLCGKHYHAARYLTRLDYFTTPQRHERVAAASAQHRLDHPEKMREYNRQYYAEHIQAEADRGRVRREANPEQVAETERRWREANPLKVRAFWAAKNARRYAQIRATRTGPIDYAAILEAHGMWCHICGYDIDSLAVLQFDHVIPLALGGPHTQANIRPAHASCNVRKGAKILVSSERRFLASQAI